eukprot:TRINITY_DN6735_c0_g1_i1.p1 TRINITY_DN6735_c0_g1~~TRINITY_DN6735_c0_g1_i1.p1  ORF type:complete len:193 (+),score=64.55 TRINITY_DN6735_c0_g1_i1:941-1519(+)
MYFCHIPQWDLIFCANSKSYQVQIFGKQDGNWVKWSFDDSGKAQLPMHEDDDTFPLGLMLSFTTTRTPEPKEAIPYPVCPSPSLLLVNHVGKVINYLVVKCGERETKSYPFMLTPSPFLPFDPSVLSGGGAAPTPTPTPSPAPAPSTSSPFSLSTSTPPAFSFPSTPGSTPFAFPSSTPSTCLLYTSPSPRD